ncbi:MAG: hypothetical protein ACXVYV_06255 [Gaiellales bacterium]
MDVSAGRAAMWIISFGVLTAGIVTLAVNGLSGIPGHWIGIVVGGALASIAFALGFYE